MVARAPRKRMYRTMQGRMVDIEKLRAANESVRAVGNMSVNARGDVIGSDGRIVQAKEEVMREYYEAPKGAVMDTPTKAKRVVAPKVQTAPEQKTMTPQPKVQPKTTPVFKPKQVEKVEKETNTVDTFKPKTETSTAKKGIDAALDGLE